MNVEKLERPEEHFDFYLWDDEDEPSERRCLICEKELQLDRSTWLVCPIHGTRGARR